MTNKFINYQIVIIWSVMLSVTGTPIYSINSVFEAFSPMSMIRFFEFSDQGWNISEGCIKDMYLYLDGLQNDQSWALKLLDASGYYAGGLYMGNDYRIGNREFCNELNNKIATYYSTEKIVYFNNSYMPFSVQNINAKYRLRLEGSEFKENKIRQNICLPKSCEYSDLLQILSYNHNLFVRINKIVKQADLIDIRILPEKFELTSEFNFAVLVGIFIFSVVIIVIASTIEKHASIKHENSIFNHEINGSCKKCEAFEESVTNMIDRGGSDTTVSVNSLTMGSNDSTENKTNISNGKSLSFGLNQNTPYSMYNQNRSKSTITNIAFNMSWKNLMSEFLTLNDRRNGIRSIAGLNVVCLFWIILTQSYTAFYYVANNKIFAKKLIGNSLFRFILGNGTYAIDTYFFLSGISISIMFYSSTDNLKIDKFAPAIEQLLYFIIMILNKLLKLILPYTVILILVQLVMKYFNAFSLIDIPSMDHQTCGSNMWRNVLYIDTFYPIIQRCMPWSWFISLEVQFFVISSVLMLLSKNHPKYSMTLCSSIFISSIITSTLMQINTPVYNVLTSTNQTLSEKLTHFNTVAEQPWIRIGPYLIGMCFGYFLHLKRNNLMLSKLLSGFFWIITMLMVTIVVLGDELATDTRPWIHASFSSSIHIMWLFVLIWIIMASNAGCGGFICYIFDLKIFLPLNRLSNCVYLVHPLIMRTVIMSSDAPIHLSYGIIITMFFGLSVISYLSGFLIYILFESPISAFLQVLHQKCIKS